MNYGTVTFNLEKLIKDKGISKTQLSYKAEISHTQINKICKGETTRIDLATVARICTALDCDISDLLIYTKPK